MQNTPPTARDTFYDGVPPESTDTWGIALKKTQEALGLLDKSGNQEVAGSSEGNNHAPDLIAPPGGLHIEKFIDRRGLYNTPAEMLKK